MVVLGSTGQLLRCTNNVSKTARYSVFSSKFFNEYKTHVTVQKVVVLPRLISYCDCRRFHYTDYFQKSRESRTTFTKLSPQEVSLV